VQGLFLFLFDLGLAYRVSKVRDYEELISDYP
jgi:hypothetical protein